MAVQNILLVIVIVNMLIAGYFTVKTYMNSQASLWLSQSAVAYNEGDEAEGKRCAEIGRKWQERASRKILRP